MISFIQIFFFRFFRRRCGKWRTNGNIWRLRKCAFFLFSHETKKKEMSYNSRSKTVNLRKYYSNQINSTIFYYTFICYLVQSLFNYSHKSISYTHRILKQHFQLWSNWFPIQRRRERKKKQLKLSRVRAYKYTRGNSSRKRKRENFKEDEISLSLNFISSPFLAAFFPAAGIWENTRDRERKKILFTFISAIVIRSRSCSGK